MTTPGQSLLNAQRPTRILVAPTETVPIGQWNVIPWFRVREGGGETRISPEMESYQNDILGISESG